MEAAWPACHAKDLSSLLCLSGFKPHPAVQKLSSVCIRNVAPASSHSGMALQLAKRDDPFCMARYSAEGGCTCLSFDSVPGCMPGQLD